MVDYALLAPAWLLALPLAWWLPWWMGRRGRRLTRLFAPLAVRLPAADESVPTARSNHVEPARWLLLPVLGLLLLALAEPVRYGATLTQRPAPLDLVLLMDVSISMGLRDYRVDGEPVDRLSVAKGLLDRFVTDFGGERVGLVVVGTPSAIWAPLTADLALIRHLLGRLELTMVGRNAAIGDALALVADRFGGEDRRPAVAVLISDGSAPLGRLSPTQVAALLQAAGVTLYSIALGGIDSVATERERGGLIFAPADLALLEEIAVQTGGRLFRAVDAGGSRRAAGLGVLRTWNDAPGRPPLGLLVFAGKAHLFFPPSADRPAVAHFLDQLPGLDLPTLGNDLAGALDLAGGLLGEIAGPRALVVLSDGDLDGPARTGSEAAASRLRERFAVDLSVVGLGGTTATAVPDPAQGWLRVEGRPVVSRLETSWLEDLAQVGDGHYLTASVEGGIALDEVWRAPAPRIADADGVLWRELYPWALIPALLLLGLGLTGRLPHLALAMVVAGLGGTMAPVPGRAAEGAAAFAALARGDSEVARGLYRSVPGYAGRFGEGVACFRLREWPCAAEAFATAAWLADDDTQRGRAAYNLAATRYRQGDYTAAARLYRDAQAHGLDQPGLKPMIDLSDVLAGQVEALREQQAGALQRARAGTRVQEAGRENDLAAGRELDLAPPPPPPLPQGMARGAFDELVARGLDQARLAGSDAAQANAGRAWFGGEDVAAERSGTQLWQRLFEIEEGFPAPVAAPRPRPEQRPW